MNKKIISILLCLIISVFFLPNLFAAPSRVSAQPIDDDVIRIYAYRTDPLVTLDENNPGFLVEIVKEVIRHPEFAVEVEVSPVAVLMKYSLIQAVGVGAIGLTSDFSSTDLKDLKEIPLYELKGKIYKLFFNSLNPQGVELFESTAENVQALKSSSRFEELMNKYKLK